MTRSLWNALTARIAILAVAAVTLGGLSVYAEAIRPDGFQLNIPMSCSTPDGTPTSCGL